MKDNIEVGDIRPISSMIRSLFAPQKKEVIDENEDEVILYDRVNIVYSYYISAINQKSIVKQFLPLNRGDIIEFLESIVGQDISTLQE